LHINEQNLLASLLTHYPLCTSVSQRHQRQKYKQMKCQDSDLRGFKVWSPPVTDSVLNDPVYRWVVRPPQHLQTDAETHTQKDT